MVRESMKDGEEDTVMIRVKKGMLPKVENLGCVTPARTRPQGYSDTGSMQHANLDHSLGPNDIEPTHEELSAGILRTYNGRCWKNIHLTRGDKERLKEKYVLVEDLPVEEVLAKINDFLKSCDADNMSFSFELFSTDKKNSYTFDYDLRQICLRRSKYPCSTSAKRRDTREKAGRIGRFLVIIKRLLEENKSIRLRALYYKYPEIHEDQKASDATVEVIALMCECTRESLNIRASPTGFIIGPIELYVDHDMLVDCLLGGVSGCLIPTEIDRINGVRRKGKVDYILVVEKEAVFHALSDLNFHKKHKCLVVTGKGQPDVATRILLRKLKECLDVPVYALVDGNPSGISIYLTYRYGSENRAYDSLLLTIPDMVLLGVFPSEVKTQTKMTNESKTMLKNMLEKDHIINDKVLRPKLKAMERGAVVADIEALMRHENIEDYIVRKIQETKKV